jgi:hypothetical protein
MPNTITPISLATFYAIVFCISSVAVGNFCKSMVTDFVMVVVMLYGHAESNYLYCFATFGWAGSCDAVKLAFELDVILTSY